MLQKGSSDEENDNLCRLQMEMTKVKGYRLVILQSLEYTNDFTSYFIQKSVISCNKSENSKEKINDTYVPAQTSCSIRITFNFFTMESPNLKPEKLNN